MNGAASVSCTTVNTTDDNKSKVQHHIQHVQFGKSCVKLSQVVACDVEVHERVEGHA